MNFTVSFSARDFSAPIPIGLTPEVTALTWCAQGGPERATLRLSGPLESLLDLTRLLRCPATVCDDRFEPIWWGFVSKITLFFEAMTFSVDIDQLTNHVIVAYTTLSQPGTAAETLTAEQRALNEAVDPAAGGGTAGQAPGRIGASLEDRSPY